MIRNPFVGLLKRIRLPHWDILMPYGIMVFATLWQWLTSWHHQANTKTNTKTSIRQPWTYFNGILHQNQTLSFCKIHLKSASKIYPIVSQCLNYGFHMRNYPCVSCIINTLRPRQNDRHFADDIFKCIFFNENVSFSINFPLEFVPKGPIDNIPVLVQIIAWRLTGDKPLSEPMMVRLPTHICFTRPQWVDFLGHCLPVCKPEVQGQSISSTLMAQFGEHKQ